MCSAHVTRGSQGEAYALATLTRRSSCFITGGDNHLAVWRIDRDSKRLSCYDVSVPKMRRTFLCIEVDQRDEVCSFSWEIKFSMCVSLGVLLRYINW